MNSIATLKKVVGALVSAHADSLPSSAFVPVRARRLRNARVVWVNWPLLRELGADVGPTGLTPQVERVLLHAFAYRIQGEGDDPAAFVGRAKLFRADRYGGDGVAPNTGSGRAAAIGVMQIKGIGVTPLADPTTPHEHRHGNLYLGDALREAAWGELNHLETPHGSNRVLAVIDVGSEFTLADGRLRRRGLLIRPLPLRPAHFMLNFYANPEPTEFRRLQQHLARALSVEQVGRALPAAQRIRSGLLQLAQRSAQQHATLMAHRAPHGAMSSSNIELSGKLLDFETQSTQPGHGPTLAIPGSRYRSDSATSLSTMLRTLAFSATLGLPKRLSRAVPSHAELASTLVDAHGQALLSQLMTLCGFPEFVLGVQPPTACYVRLAMRIQDLACDEGEPTGIERGVPAWTGTYDVGNVLFCLACLHHRGMHVAKRALVEARSDGKLTALIESYFTFRDELDEVARVQGVAPEVLDELVIRVASVRNAKRPELYLPQLQRRNALILADYLGKSDAAIVGRQIESLIDGNRRFFADSPAKCVIREWTDRVSGATVRYSFVPHKGYLLEVMAPAQQGLVHFFGQQLALASDAAASASMRLGSPGKPAVRQRFKVSREPGAVRLGAWLDPEVVRFAIRLEASSSATEPLLFDPLPRAYFSGVRRIQRGAPLRQAIAPA
jgi:hypothetical protein